MAESIIAGLIALGATMVLLVAWMAHNARKRKPPATEATEPPPPTPAEQVQSGRESLRIPMDWRSLMNRAVPALILAAGIVAAAFIVRDGIVEAAGRVDASYAIDKVANALGKLNVGVPSEIDVTLHPNTVGNVFPVAVSGSILSHGLR